MDIGAMRVNTLENYIEQQVQQGNKKLEYGSFQIGKDFITEISLLMCTSICFYLIIYSDSTLGY